MKISKEQAVRYFKDNSFPYSFNYASLFKNENMQAIFEAFDIRGEGLRKFYMDHKKKRNWEILVHVLRIHVSDWAQTKRQIQNSRGTTEFPGVRDLSVQYKEFSQKMPIQQGESIEHWHFRMNCAGLSGAHIADANERNRELSDYYFNCGR